MRKGTKMEKDFVAQWNKNKDRLLDYFKNNDNHTALDYDEIVKKLFELVINHEANTTYSVEDMVVMTHGDYQGTQVYILHKQTYQPDVTDYVYTHNYYGSCSGCDTLQSLQGYGSDAKVPDEEQLTEYMQLALNLLQQLRYMKD